MRCACACASRVAPRATVRISSNATCLGRGVSLPTFDRIHQRGCLRCAPCTEWVGPWPQPSRHMHLPFWVGPWPQPPRHRHLPFWVGPWPQPPRHRHPPFSRWAQRGITGAPLVSGSSSFVCTRARQAPAPIGPPATASSHRSAPLRLSPTCLPHGCRTAEAHTGAGLAEGRRGVPRDHAVERAPFDGHGA